MSRVLTPADLDVFGCELPVWVGVDAVVGAQVVPTRFGERLVIPLLLSGQDIEGGKVGAWYPIGSYWPSRRSKAILDAKLGTQYAQWTGVTFPLIIVRHVLNPFTRTRHDVLAVAPADEWDAIRTAAADGTGGTTSSPAD